jgi:hypothetical protein
LFALLGLASDGNEAEFEPDYNIPLEQIVHKFAKVFVRQGRGMQLLYRSSLSQDADRFPSWIPDWTVQLSSSLHDSSEGGVDFAASGPQQAKIECIPDTDELSVDGYAFDIIKSISTSANLEQEWSKYFEEVNSMIDSAVLSSVRDSREDLKWKVPIAGALYPKEALSDCLDLKSSYEALQRYIMNNWEEKSKAIEMNNSQFQISLWHLRKQCTSYMSALQDTLRGWRFVVMKRGYVGVVPNLAKLGDTVAIFKGGQIPFVLQTSVERPGAFRLVGGCYVHGVMNGEGLMLPGVDESNFRIH